MNKENHSLLNYENLYKRMVLIHRQSNEKCKNDDGEHLNFLIGDFAQDLFDDIEKQQYKLASMTNRVIITIDWLDLNIRNGERHEGRVTAKLTNNDDISVMCISHFNYIVPNFKQSLSSAIESNELFKMVVNERVPDFNGQVGTIADMEKLVNEMGYCAKFLVLDSTKFRDSFITSPEYSALKEYTYTQRFNHNTIVTGVTLVPKQDY